MGLFGPSARDIAYDAKRTLQEHITDCTERARIVDASLQEIKVTLNKAQYGLIVILFSIIGELVMRFIVKGN